MFSIYARVFILDGSPEHDAHICRYFDLLKAFERVFEFPTPKKILEKRNNFACATWFEIPSYISTIIYEVWIVIELREAAKNVFFSGPATKALLPLAFTHPFLLFGPLRKQLFLRLPYTASFYVCCRKVVLFLQD